MGKRGGGILMPAVVFRDGIVSGILITFSQMGTSKTFCLVLNCQPWLENPHIRVGLKIFDKEAASELCSTHSFSDMSIRLEGMRLDNLGFATLLGSFEGYTLDRGRILAKISITILDYILMITHTILTFSNSHINQDSSQTI